MVADAAGRVMTVSRAVAAERCRRLERLQYGAGLLRIALVAEPSARVRGTCVHAGMAAGLLAFPDPPRPEAVREAVARAAVEEGIGASHPDVAPWTRIALRALSAMQPSDWEPALLGGEPLVERRLEVPLRRPGEPAWAVGGWVLSIKPDAVLRHRPTGRLWGWDHKTHASLQSAQPWTELHLQALAYWRALGDLGVELDGFCLYHILAGEPREPKLRADGYLSEAACVTDWPTALRAIARSEDPDPDSPRYDALRASCAAREWQRPQQVICTSEERALAWEWLLDARDDVDASAAASARWGALPSGHALGQPSGRGWACAGCDYADLCAEQFRAGDPARLIGEAYRVGGDRYLAELRGSIFSAQGLRPDRAGSPCAQDLRGVRSSGPAAEDRH